MNQNEKIEILKFQLSLNELITELETLKLKSEGITYKSFVIILINHLKDLLLKVEKSIEENKIELNN